MASEHEITIVSTYTCDLMRDRVTGEVHEVPGGPAHYVANALARLNVPYSVISGDVVRVEVLSTADGEHYVIPSIERIPLPNILRGSAVILSPVMQEIDPTTVPAVDGMLVIDLQGFVREPSRPTDAVGHTFELRELLQRASVVKAADSELLRLTPSSRDALRDTILVLTRGKDGAVIQHGDSSHQVTARPVRARHTVGAGDTFLAAFVHGLLLKKDISEAGTYAARFTERVLSERI